MYFYFKSLRISFISKVTGVHHKAMTVANDISLCSTILFVFPEFVPVDRAEISHLNTPQNSPRLSGSCEEALRTEKIRHYIYEVIPELRDIWCIKWK